MTSSSPLPVTALRRACDLSALQFRTTADLAPHAGLVAQDRATSAVQLGIAMPSRGYNVFALGPPGIGKRALAQQLIGHEARPRSEPADWCYVHNFEQPFRPRALKLPAGRGGRLRQDMREAVEELSAAIPAVFESEEFRNRFEQIGAQIEARAQEQFEALGHEAEKDGIALVHTPAGFTLAPVKDGEVLSTEAFAALPEERRAHLQGRLEALQSGLQRAIREVQRLQKERRAQVRELNREMTLAVVASVIDDLRVGYGDLPAVLAYLDAVQIDVLDNVDEFRRAAEPQPGAPALAESDPEALHRYQVNVIIGDARDDAFAPVVQEDYPTYANLLGRIEYVARFGTLLTDFTLIKAGALHRANGGYLLLDAHKLLTQPFAWDGLKRALSTGEIHTESPGQSYGLLNTVALEPEPIPLDVKVILFGERPTYYLLLQLDAEFGELFKIAADFDDDVPRTAANECTWARLVAAFVAREQLLPLDREAVARVVEHASRLAGDARRLSAELERIGDLLRESTQLARQRGLDVVTPADVEHALALARERGGRIRGAIERATVEGDLLIDTAGARVGQINALSVSMLGRDSFGHPSRITATSRLGSGQVIDIQREVELGGPQHTKGVLILSSFLASRYSSDRPHSLSASLVFEQTYGAVEGDSASLAELCVLLSSLSGLPIRQSLAVTGSVNQHGVVQAIGGVNEKIEGFFDLCAARGLGGSHGVLIPASNAAQLMLDARVVQAAAAGRFDIFTCDTVDTAIEILTGVPAGTPDADGLYPADTVNGRVAARLDELSTLRQTYVQIIGQAEAETEAAEGTPEGRPS